MGASRRSWARASWGTPSTKRAGSVRSMSAIAVAMSEPLDDRSCGQRPTTAHRDQRGRLVSAFEFMQRGGDQPAAGRAHGVAEGDGTTVDVDLVPVDLMDLAPRQDDRRE